MEPGAILTHEWRDWRTGSYKTGPSLAIADGKLQVGGADLMALPTDVWMRFEVRSAIGKPGAPWSLTVTLPGQAPRQFTDLKSAPDFGALTWIGFVSNATTKTVFYLDDLELTNTAN
jgi:hypothetical protein